MYGLGQGLWTNLVFVWIGRIIMKVDCLRQSFKNLLFGCVCLALDEELALMKFKAVAKSEHRLVV